MVGDCAGVPKAEIKERLATSSGKQQLFLMAATGRRLAKIVYRVEIFFKEPIPLQMEKRFATLQRSEMFDAINHAKQSQLKLQLMQKLVFGATW
jgi:hypothetical protein